MKSLETGQRPVAIVDICLVLTADICLVLTADICLVAAADICPVSSADICSVSTEDIKAAGQRLTAGTCPVFCQDRIVVFC